MGFPVNRGRRLRGHPALREMVGETALRRSQLVTPLFVCPGAAVREEVASMPGVYRLSVDCLVEEGKRLIDLGLGSVILFGIPESKDPLGTGAYADDGIVQRALRALREKVPGLYLIGDVCLCEYTSHGHCGVLRDGEVENDETLGLLARTALSHVRAGAHMVAPSDMMDGRVARIREELDQGGHAAVPIMSYAAKYSSAFYGPFRDAADSAPQTGDRRGYQMDPRNVREALREVEWDLEEGADIVMVKPALAYLDVIRRVRERVDVPVAAYNVSGEYAMVKAAARLGWVDEKRIVAELLLGIRRAGADLILTYFAPQIAGELPA